MSLPKYKSPDKTNPRLIYLLPPGATSDPHDAKYVRTAPVLNRINGGLVTLPKCGPGDFSRFVDFLTGEPTTLDDFCRRSPPYCKWKQYLREFGTIEGP